MNFLRHIQACNQHQATEFIPFVVDDIQVGHLRFEFAEILMQWPDVFAYHNDVVCLTVKESDLSLRSKSVAEILQVLVGRGVLEFLHGEQYIATPSNRESGVLLIDRAAAPYFGIRAFGQHVNGYVREKGRTSMWIGKRAEDRRHYPGKLDHLAAGGLPYDISLSDNLVKECNEEAGIPASLAKSARPVGTVTYNADTVNGFKPDTLYCYDLELPSDFQPYCRDGEVQAFYLWPVEEVMDRVGKTDEFKLNCNLVIIDFLIRHGFINTEHPQYLELTTGLHPPPL